LDPTLQSTEFMDSEHPAIVALASEVRRDTPTETAIAAFDWVRDRIAYDPYTALLDDPAEYRASTILARGRGFCVHKAVLLAAVCRAAGIPARLGFADVRNHRTPPKLLELMGTDVFVFHGYVVLYLDGRWVKATPTFDPETSRRANALPVQLDGTHDAMLHPVDPEGHPHIDYLRDRGAYDDLPYEEMRRTFFEVYTL